MGGLIGLPGIFPYTAAKGGVIAMTKQMAVTYGPDNVRVNAICPGTIPTPLVYQSRVDRGAADADATRLRSTPRSRIGSRFAASGPLTISPR